MQINLKLNGKRLRKRSQMTCFSLICAEARLLQREERLRDGKLRALHGILNGKPVLSCSVLTARANGQEVTTLEGLQPEAEEIGSFLAGQGAEQCGFCNPGFMMNAIALFRENQDPTDEEILEYLSGNLCRCSGYEGQLRAMKKYLAWKKEKQEVGA